MRQGSGSLRALAALCALSTTAPLSAQSLPPTAVTVLHEFTAADGVPAGRLVQGADGALYGVLPNGGASGSGSIFRIDVAGNFTTLYSFGSPSLSANDGATPSELVSGPDGNLYGTTMGGGANFGGTVFRLTLAGELTTIVNFGGSPTAGFQPSAPVHFGADGNIYGTTNAGGSGGGGTVFRSTPSGTLTVLRNVPADGSEGVNPDGALVMGDDGTVYGTMSNAGFHPNVGSGTAFKIAPDGGFSILHYFPYTAFNVISGLVFGPDGALYGLDQNGGAAGAGEVFSISPDGLFRQLHSFGCSCATPDGSEVVGALTRASDDNFYGVTAFGGTSNSGTIFRISASGAVTPLHSFEGPDGGPPVGGVVEARDGRFYGMTSSIYNHVATIYRLTLPPFDGPTNVGAVAADGSISLSWTATKGASSYNIYEGTSPDAEDATPALTGSTGTSATLTGLQNGKTYYLVVSAVNEGGSGPMSAEVAAQPIAPPTGVSARPGDTSVTLSWSAASGSASYSVYQGDHAAGEAIGPIATGVTATSLTITGLTNGKTYYFQVASVNGPTTVRSAEVTGTPDGPQVTGSGGGGGALDDLVLAMLALQASRALHKRKSNT